jgi:TATA-box binding protein (TBP) (component of TFIID and TFIIIB)
MAFDDIPVSTQTFTVRSNIQNIELNQFYDEIQASSPRTDSVGFSEAAILCVKYKEQRKGSDPEKDLKTKRKRSVSKEQEVPKTTNFLNCVTLIVQIEKRINIKIFRNGVFQLTGCKNIDNVQRCINLILNELSKSTTKCFQFEEGYDDFVIYIKSAMRNIDFDLGFKVNRTLLANRLTCKYAEDDDVIIPDAIGNKMDVKIKIRINREELERLLITKITHPTHPDFKKEEVMYKDCLHIIEPSKKLETKLKDKFISISVFQNGKVLLSAMDASIQEKYYKWFTCLIKEIEKDIKQPVSPKKTFMVFNNRKQSKIDI